jgi:hypothetical protein
MDRPVFWGGMVMSMMMDIHDQAIHIEAQYTSSTDN